MTFYFCKEIIQVRWKLYHYALEANVWKSRPESLEVGVLMVYSGYPRESSKGVFFFSLSLFFIFLVRVKQNIENLVLKKKVVILPFVLCLYSVSFILVCQFILFSNKSPCLNFSLHEIFVNIEDNVRFKCGGTVVF